MYILYNIYSIYKKKTKKIKLKIIVKKKIIENIYRNTLANIKKMMN